jgi:Right handed beta helix region
MHPVRGSQGRLLLVGAGLVALLAGLWSLSRDEPHDKPDPARLHAAYGPAKAPSKPTSAGRPCNKIASTTGSDRSDTGSRRDPYRTIRRLIRSLRPGQTGCFRAGTYRRTVTFDRRGRKGRPITLRSFPGERARIVGRFLVPRRARHLVVRGLTLDGRNSRDLPSPNINAPNVRFSGNDVTNGGTPAICFLLGSRRFGRAEAAVIEGNRIHDCGAGRLDHGIYLESAQGVVIQDNWIYDNADFGVQLYPDAQGTLVRRNVIWGNGQGITFSGDGDRASSDNAVERNVIGGSRARHNVEAFWRGDSPVGEGNVLRRNCLFSDATERSTGGVQSPPVGFAATENVVGDPLFADLESDDFRLRRGSPCRSLVGSTAGWPDPPRRGRPG